MATLKVKIKVMKNCSSCKRDFRVTNGVFEPSPQLGQLEEDISKSMECINRSAQMYGQDHVIAQEAYELSKMLFHQNLSGPAQPKHFDIIKLPIPKIGTSDRFKDADMQDESTTKSDSEEDLYVPDSADEDDSDDWMIGPPRKKSRQKLKNRPASRKSNRKKDKKLQKNDSRYTE